MGPYRELDYVVRRVDDHWTIDFNGWVSGCFASSDAAVEAAAADAERVRRQWGHAVRVKVVPGETRRGLAPVRADTVKRAAGGHGPHRESGCR
jgi:hypothetical protein